MIAHPKVYEASVHALVNGARTVVVSVDYRLVPEHKFLVAPEDAYANYRWVFSYAQELNGDAKRVAVAGERVGGILAVVVSLMARNKRQPLPLHALLIDTVVDSNLQNSSYLQNAHDTPLDLAMRMRSVFASSAESDRVTGRFRQVGPRTLRHDACRMTRRRRLRTAHPVDDQRHRRVQIQIPFLVSP